MATSTGGSGGVQVEVREDREGAGHGGVQVEGGKAGKDGWDKVATGGRGAGGVLAWLCGVYSTTVP